MIMEFGKPYLDRLNEHMSAAGLVEIDVSDTVPSAPSDVTLAVGAPSQGSSTSGAMWNGCSVRYSQTVRTAVVTCEAYDPWKEQPPDPWKEQTWEEPAW